MRLHLSPLTRATIAIAAASAAIVLFIWLSGLFMSVRLRAGDLYFVGAEGATEQLKGSIAIIALDDRSLQTYGRSLTDWDRAVYATMLDRLAADGARVAAFDLIFSESSASDEVLADAMLRARESDARTRIVLPIAGTGVPLPAQRLVGAGLSPAQRAAANAIRFGNQLQPVSILAERADYMAYVNTLIDVDGIVRRQPSIVQRGEQISYGFSLAAYLAWLRVPSSAAGQVAQPDGRSLTIGNNLVVNRDELGIWRQNFYGAPGVTFPVYSLVDVVDGTVPAGAFTDRIVFIGLMNSQGLADSYSIPLSDNGQAMAGVEILTHATATLLANDVPYDQPPVGVFIMLLVISIACSILFTRVVWLGKAIGVPLLILVLFIAGSINFSARGELIALFDGVLAIVVPGGLALGYEIRSERQARRRIQSLFETAEGQRRLIDAIFRHSPTPMALLDGQLAVERANDAFAALFSPDDPPSFSGRLARAGMIPEAVRRIVDAITTHDPEPPKLMLRGKTFLIGSAPIGIQDYRVITLSDVTSLDDLSALKTRLIRIAAHDVRNPLSSIIGFSDLLLMDQHNLPERPREVIGRIRNSAQAINNIMTSLLKLEQLRSTTLPLEPVSVTLLLRQVAESLLPEMEQRRHDFIVDVPLADLLLVKAEPVQLGQAVSNLLTNAAKYTPNGGRIRLVAAATPERKVQIHVIDNGYGIAKDAQDKLFTEFYRVRSDAVAKIEGTGLGLSLVKTIIEAHQGRVWVESETGKGSTFGIEIPMMEKVMNG